MNEKEDKKTLYFIKCSMHRVTVTGQIEKFFVQKKNQIVMMMTRAQ